MILEYSILILYLGLFTFLAWRNFNLALGLFFFLLPSYLIRFQFGPFPTTLLELMLFIIFSVWLIKNVSPISYLLSFFRAHHSLFLATGLFLLAATFSIFTSVNTRAALGEWKAFYVEPVLLFLILVTIWKNTPSPISYLLSPILYGLLSCGVATSIFAIYQHFTGWGVPWDFWENRNTFRVTAWYGFPNAVGLFLAPLIPLAMYLVKQSWDKIRTRDMRYKIQDIGIWVLFLSPIFYLLSSTLAVFFAKSTGGLIGIAAGLGILLLLNKKTRGLAIALGFLGILGLFSLSSDSPIRQEILAQDRSGHIRVEMWGETVQYLSEHPVTGAGLASYATAIAPYRINKNIEVFHHPHNIFLTMWVNLGILGLVGFIWVIVRFYRTALSRNNGAMEQWNNGTIIPFLIASMTTVLVTGLVDSPYIKNDLSIFFWTLIALLVLSVQDKNLKSAI